MSPDKDAKLRADYPLVFQKPLGEPIRCGDGWYHLLNNLCRTMNRIIGFQPEEQRWRYAARCVKETHVLQKLFAEIGPKFAARPGGYTRILKIGHRPGDGADQARIELVEG